MIIRPGGILCLDTATRTGVVYGHDAHTVPWWEVITVRGMSDPAASFVGLDNELTDLIERLRPKRVVYEAPLSYTKKKRDPMLPFLLLGLAAHVESACYRAEVECRQRHVNRVRERVIGQGSFAKPLRGEGKVRKGTGGTPDRVRGDAKQEVELWCRSIGWGAITDHNARDAAVLLRHEWMFMEAKGGTKP